MRDIDEIIKEVKSIGETSKKVKISNEIIKKLNSLREDYTKEFCNKYYRTSSNDSYNSGYYYIENMIIENGKVMINGWKINEHFFRDSRSYTIESLIDYYLCESNKFSKEFIEIDMTKKPNEDRNIDDLKTTIMDMKALANKINA